ncbi:MAG: Flp pilus assembly protein CpaB [Actinomycetota bacterium]
MKSRAASGVLAVVLACAATLAVFMYLSGVKRKAAAGADMVSVVVARNDVPAESSLDEELAGGSFALTEVAEDSLVKSAATDLSQLEGHRTASAILEGEQVSLARLDGSKELPGGRLGIPAGMQAVDIPLEAPRALSGELRSGDHVTVYATFQDFGADNRLDGTVTLVPDASVLRVSGEAGSSAVGLGAGTTTELSVTMALRPAEAQKVVFAKENGSVWLSLLPPDQKGSRLRPATQNEVIR